MIPIESISERRVRLLGLELGDLDIRSLKIKSEKSHFRMRFLVSYQNSNMQLSENRARLLNYLQHKCQNYHFKRETYYLSQSFFDAVLTHGIYHVHEWKKLGIACLYLAMKVEEVDLVSLRDVLRPQAERPPEFSSEEMVKLERDIVRTFKFKLLPDTLIFWLDLAVRLWDIFV